MSNLNNLIWETKYRPNKVEDTILPVETKKMIQDIIASGNIPNFLFSGTSGVGKTTLAKAIAAELDADLLFINASMDGNIDTLRTTITQFVSTVSFTDSKKIVLLDEADHLNPQSTQPAMRGFLDEFSKNAIFILTCNFSHKIIAPLQSRLTVIDFKFNKEEMQSAAKQMMVRCCDILEKESVTFDRKSVAGLVSKNFPDFRKTLVQLQRYSTSGTIDSGIMVASSDNLSDLFKMVKGKDFAGCKKWVANNTLSPQTFYRGIYDKMLPELIPQSVPDIIDIINKFQYEATSSVDMEINQIAFLIHAMATSRFK